MIERRVDISHETIQRLVDKFGLIDARRFEHR